MVQSFCQDVRLFSSQILPQHIVKEHSELFLQSMMNHLSLLPAPHLALLTLLHRYQWSSDSIFQFFLKSFVEPLVISHFNASPLSAHLDNFKFLVKHLSGNVIASSIGPLFLTESIFDVPNAFSDFSEAGVAFITTPLDVAVFLEVAKDCVELPRLLKMLQSQRYCDTSQPYAPIWVKVFPKNPPPGLYSDIWRHVVFPYVTRKVEVKEWVLPHFERRYRQIAQIARDNATNPVFLLEQEPTSRESQVIRNFRDDCAIDKKGFCRGCMESHPCEKCAVLSANRQPIRFYDFTLNMCLSDLRERALAFERLLVHRFALQRLNGWSELIERALKVETYNASQQSMIAGMRKRSVSDPTLILAEIGSLFDDAITRQTSLAMRVEMIAILFVKDHSARFQTLREYWQAVIEERVEDRAIPQKLKKPNMARVLKTVMAMRNILATVHVVPFYRRFFRIMEVLRTLDFLERSLDLPESSIVRYVVALSDTDDPDNVFLETVLSISALLVHTVDFALEIGNEAKTLWGRFEEVVLVGVHSQPEIAKLYQQLHDEIQAQL
jgi:hypothetical protein